MTLKHKCRTLKKIILKKNNACQQCENKNFLELHHKIPLSMGGFNSPANVALLCRECHRTETKKFLKSYFNRDKLESLVRKLKKRKFDDFRTYKILFSLDHY